MAGLIGASMFCAFAAGQMYGQMQAPTYSTQPLSQKTYGAPSNYQQTYAQQAYAAPSNFQTYAGSNYQMYAEPAIYEQTYTQQTYAVPSTYSKQDYIYDAPSYYEQPSVSWEVDYPYETQGYSHTGSQQEDTYEYAMYTTPTVSTYSKPSLSTYSRPSNYGSQPAYSTQVPSFGMYVHDQPVSMGVEQQLEPSYATAQTYSDPDLDYVYGQDRPAQQAIYYQHKPAQTYQVYATVTTEPEPPVTTSYSYDVPVLVDPRASNYNYDITSDHYNYQHDYWQHQTPQGPQTPATQTSGYNTYSRGGVFMEADRYLPGDYDTIGVYQAMGDHDGVLPHYDAPTAQNHAHADLDWTPYGTNSHTFFNRDVYFNPGQYPGNYDVQYDMRNTYYGPLPTGRDPRQEYLMNMARYIRGRQD